MECEKCGSTELEKEKFSYKCKKCGFEGKVPRRQYTYPLDDGIGSYAKKKRN